MQENHGYNPKSRSTLLEKLKNDGKKMRSSVLYFIILFARWRDYLLQRYSFHAKNKCYFYNETKCGCVGSESVEIGNFQFFVVFV